MKLEQIQDPRLVRRIKEAMGEVDTLKQDIVKAIPRKRIRQRSSDGMNQLEREALAYLKEEDRRAKTGFQFRTHSLTLRLANGCRYTIDITGFGEKRGEIHAWEVKGRQAWDDAIVKLKVAAAQWPSISFYLMWKENGVWQTQHVLP